MVQLPKGHPGPRGVGHPGPEEPVTRRSHTVTLAEQLTFVLSLAFHVLLVYFMAPDPAANALLSLLPP